VPARQALPVAALGVFLIGGVALALLVYFDLQTNLPFNDEWARQWTIQRFLDGHGFALWGSNPGLVQLGASLLLALAHTQPAVWRLGAVPFVALGGWASWKLAIRLGAAPFWSAVAAVVVPASPLFLSVSTGIMNETAFFGLYMAGIWLLVSATFDGGPYLLAAGMAFLATIQRQQGAALLPGLVLALALIVATRKRALQWRDATGLLAMAVAVGLAWVIPQHLRPSSTLGVRPLATSSVWTGTLNGFTSLAPFMLIPLAPGLLYLPKAQRRLSILQLVPLAIAGAGILAAWRPVLQGVGDLFPGNYLLGWTLGPPSLPGLYPMVVSFKPPIFPAPLFHGIEIAATATLVLLFAYRSLAWHPRHLGPIGVVLVFFAVVQLGAIVYYGGAVFDRFFLEVIPPLVPLVAAMAPAGARAYLAKAVTVLLLLAGLALYAVGEQDYEAWQVARDQVANLAYRHYPAYRVNAGFEETARHVWIPATDNPGAHLERALARNPAVYIVWALPGDPRVGVRYQSAAPGKVVLQVWPLGPETYRVPQ